MKSSLADSEIAKSLPSNNSTDPCPEMANKQLHTTKEFDCAVKEKVVVWSAALADRASRTGHVPKTNLLKVEPMPSSSRSQP